MAQFKNLEELKEFAEKLGNEKLQKGIKCVEKVLLLLKKYWIEDYKIEINIDEIKYYDSFTIYVVLEDVVLKDKEKSKKEEEFLAKLEELLSDIVDLNAYYERTMHDYITLTEGDSIDYEYDYETLKIEFKIYINFVDETLKRLENIEKEAKAMLIKEKI